MASDQSLLADDDGGLGPKDRVVMREETPSTHGCRIFCRAHLQVQASKRGINPRWPQICVPSKPHWTRYSLVDARRKRDEAAATPREAR